MPRQAGVEPGKETFVNVVTSRRFVELAREGHRGTDVCFENGRALHGFRAGAERAAEFVTSRVRVETGVLRQDVVRIGILHRVV